MPSKSFADGTTTPLERRDGYLASDKIRAARGLLRLGDSDGAHHQACLAMDDIAQITLTWGRE